MAVEGYKGMPKQLYLVVRRNENTGNISRSFVMAFEWWAHRRAGHAGEVYELPLPPLNELRRIK